MGREPGPLYHMVNRMLKYGLVLGAVGGFLVAWMVAIFMRYPYALSFVGLAEHIINGLFLGFLIGGISGFIYGSTAGLLCGFLMAFVTTLAFHEIRNPQRFKSVMGVIAAVGTMATFYFGGLWGFIQFINYELFYIDVEATMVGAMIFSIVIAVYASQIVSKKYTQEVGLLKKKKGVA